MHSITWNIIFDTFPFGSTNFTRIAYLYGKMPSNMKTVEKSKMQQFAVNLLLSVLHQVLLMHVLYTMLIPNTNITRIFHKRTFFRVPFLFPFVVLYFLLLFHHSIFAPLVTVGRWRMLSLYLSYTLKIRCLVCFFFSSRSPTHISARLHFIATFFNLYLWHRCDKILFKFLFIVSSFFALLFIPSMHRTLCACKLLLDLLLFEFVSFLALHFWYSFDILHDTFFRSFKFFMASGFITVVNGIVSTAYKII